MPPHLSDGGGDKAPPFDKMAVDVGLFGEAQGTDPFGSAGDSLQRASGAF